MRSLAPSSLPDGPARELHEALHVLHHRAGWPSLRQMARGVGCSHTTLAKVFRSPDVTSWESLDRVVRLLRGDVEFFRLLWFRATGGDVPPPVPHEAATRRGLRLVTPPESSPWTDGPANPAASPPVTQVPAPLPTIAELRRRVAHDLDQPLGSASHGDIGTQMDRFEGSLLTLCALAVLDLLGESAESAGPGVVLVEMAGRRLAVKLRPDVYRERTLRVVFQDPARPEPDPLHDLDRRGEIVGSIGRFDTVHLTLPREFDDAFVGALVHQLVVTLGAGYEILDRRAREALAHVQTAFDRAVCSQLSDVVAGLGEPDLWVLLVCRQRVWPAVAPEIVDRVLQRARMLQDPLLAPVRRAYSVLADPPPLGKSMREALDTGRPVTSRTESGTLRRRDDLLGLIMPVETDVSVLPLVVGERISILAAVPRHAAERAVGVLAPRAAALARLADQY